MTSPARQLELYDPPAPAPLEQRRPGLRRLRLVVPVCAGCHAKPARYGFRDEEGVSLSRTLCFECFHTEIMRRLDIARRLARARAARQVELPLDDVRHRADVRRRRAQIAARRALGIR
jgi:hypothetical protein